MKILPQSTKRSKRENGFSPSTASSASSSPPTATPTAASTKRNGELHTAKAMKQLSESRQENGSAMTAVA